MEPTEYDQSQEKIDKEIDAKSEEQLERERDPYMNSTVIAKLKDRQKNGQSLKIACLDIDSTLTGDIEKQKKARELLEDQGYVIA